MVRVGVLHAGMGQEGGRHWQNSMDPHLPMNTHSTLYTTTVEGEVKAVAKAAMVEKMATTAAMGVVAAVAGAAWEVILSLSAPSWPEFLLCSQAIEWNYVPSRVKMMRHWGEIAINCWREKFFYVGLVLRGVAF